jgi:hypothetical protein
MSGHQLNHGDSHAIDYPLKINGQSHLRVLSG